MHLRKSIVLSLIGCMFLSSSAFAAQDGDYIYTESGGNATITAYTSAGGSISIPATLGGYPTVALGDSAFSNKTSLTSVSIPGSVTSIGQDAFYLCTGLTSVTIPGSVTSMGYHAFWYCTGLTSAYFNGNAPSMGAGIFDNCAVDFTVYYTDGSTGFTDPWNGYPTAVFTPPSTTTEPSTSSTTTTQPTTTTTVQPKTSISTSSIVPTTTTTVQPTTSSSTSSLIPPTTTQVTLGWDQNTEPDLAGYKIYYGNSSGNYTQIKEDIGKTATSCTITNLTEGQTYYFAATSYNSSLVESNYSAEVSWPIAPATTSVPTTGGGGGGGYPPRTSTTTIATTTIKVTTSTTTSAPPPECVLDADCDDKVFCNGTEKCINGTCVNGQNPCGEEQVCKEELQQCRDVVSITAASLLRKVVMRPILLDKKCLWLIVYPSQDHHFMPESSSIEITGPAAGAYGVMIDSRQSAVSVGRFIFVPVCIEQGATTGQWNITIKTDVTNASLEETIVTSFQVK